MSPAAYAVAFAIGLVIAIVGFVVVSTYNDVTGRRQRIDKAWSNIDAVLKQRHDGLPALVDAVRDLLPDERDVLVEVTEARDAYAPTAPIPVQAGASHRTTAAVRTLFSTVERHPAVREAPAVADLRSEIELLEVKIADRRELYNDQVHRYNTRIARAPASRLATVFQWRARDLFTAGTSVSVSPDASIDGARAHD